MNDHDLSINFSMNKNGVTSAFSDTTIVLWYAAEVLYVSISHFITQKDLYSRVEVFFNDKFYCFINGILSKTDFSL